MQTTSLEVSRELEKAGFWEKREPHYMHALDGPTFEITNLCNGGYSTQTPAATYDDLIPALGLDKPNKDHCVSADGCGGWTYYFDITVRDKGFTPNTLADVWLDLKRRGCRNPAEIFPIPDTWGEGGK